MGWTPPPRPPWLERLNALGPSAGQAADLVPLDPDEMIATASRSVDLHDFGPDTWLPHYRVLCAALEDEARLHTAGRLVVRAEILRSLRNRLLVTRAASADRTASDQTVAAPLFVVGTARSGTSILHEMLGCDPAHRLPHTWEVLHPVAGPEAHDRRVIGDREVTLWPELVPEYRAMHLNGGELPTECIFLTMNEFLSDQWGGCHSVPSYSSHLLTNDHGDAYRWHRRQLRLMGQRGAAGRWVLKAPSHLATLDALFEVYPDAQVIFIHRDPLATVPSTIDLMGTLKWMRSDHVDMADTIALLPVGFALMLESIIERRADATLPDDQFADVRFDDLMADPAEAIGDAYRQLGLELSPSVGQAITDYARAKPRHQHGRHQYSLEAMGLDPHAERERFAFYTDHYGLDV